MATWYSTAITGRTVVLHRVAINYARWEALTACGRAVRMEEMTLDAEGEWSEEYCEYIRQRRGWHLVLCSHCRDREPAWERKRRTRRRQRQKCR